MIIPKILKVIIFLLVWSAVSLASSSTIWAPYRAQIASFWRSPSPKWGSSLKPTFTTIAMKKKSEVCQLLPMVINTWNFPDANAQAWSTLKQSPGGLNQTRNAVVNGVNKCEKMQCELAVGYGGSPNEMGDTTLDAMVMDGATMKVGAVAGLQGIRDAIRVARHVMEHTAHTLLVGNSASEFAKAMGFRAEPMITSESAAMWEEWNARNCQPNFWNNVLPDPRTSCGPYTPLTKPTQNDRSRTDFGIGEKNHDTITMIAMDVKQQIHVGTSTNGVPYKVPGRAGDAAVPGAGGYADNEVGAAVSTGDGDIMMRFLPSLLAVEAMRNGKTPAEAAESSIKRIIKHYKDFSGALVAVNNLGEYAAFCYGFPEFPFVVSNPMQTNNLVIIKCLPKLPDSDM